MSFLIDSNNSLKKAALIGTVGLALIIGIFRFFGEDQDEEAEEAHAKEGKKPAGIYNEGNTCFVNSLLQALASIKSFEQNLRQAIGRFKERQDANQQLISQLYTVITKINSNSGSIDVVQLLDLISEVKRDLINLEQQDAHELYAAIVTSFDTALNKNKIMDISASLKLLQNQDQIENSLIGYTKSSIVCSTCRNQTAIKIHPFFDLSLEIRPMHVMDIKTALREFEKEERIESWTCSKCSILRHNRKIAFALGRIKGLNKETLERIGKQIMQFLDKMDSGQYEIAEINDSLGQFVTKFEQEYKEMSGDAERDLIFVQLEGVQSTILKRTVVTKYPKVLVLHLKQLVINPFTGNPELLRKHINFQENLSIATKTREKIYRLTSLLTHIGNESMGHYYAFRRLNRSSDDWYVISDSDSKRCEWNYVRQSRAYMLFYETD